MQKNIIVAAASEVSERGNKGQQITHSIIPSVIIQSFPHHLANSGLLLLFIADCVCRIFFWFFIQGQTHYWCPNNLKELAVWTCLLYSTFDSFVFIITCFINIYNICITRHIISQHIDISGGVKVMKKEMIMMDNPLNKVNGMTYDNPPTAVK